MIHTRFFPEDTQKHAMIYRDPQIQTLNEGLRTLYRVTNPILCYTQRISIAAPTLDRSYENHIRHNEELGLFYVSFPAECTYMTNFRTNHGAACRMVTYYRDSETGYVKEIAVTQQLELRNGKDVTVLLYTNYKTDLVLSYDVYLLKQQKPTARL